MMEEGIGCIPENLKPEIVDDLYKGELYFWKQQIAAQ
jgi:hypothetical protein